MAAIPKKYIVVDAAFSAENETWVQNIWSFDTIHEADIQYHARAGALMGSTKYKKALIFVVSTDGNIFHNDVLDTSYVEEA